jgi:hypothetical protein
MEEETEEAEEDDRRASDPAANGLLLPPLLLIPLLWEAKYAADVTLVGDRLKDFPAGKVATTCPLLLLLLPPGVDFLGNTWAVERKAAVDTVGELAPPEEEVVNVLVGAAAVAAVPLCRTCCCPPPPPPRVVGPSRAPVEGATMVVVVEEWRRGREKADLARALCDRSTMPPYWGSALTPPSLLLAAEDLPPPPPLFPGKPAKAS